MKMKIYTKTELGKGYIPSDKVSYKNVRFEDFGFDAFGMDFKQIRKEWDKVKYKDNQTRKLFIEQLKLNILKVINENKEFNKENYHTHLYINFNSDFPQIFISR